jgi:2-oxoglutarate dehydrogenase complex dehydrogenase (E1) component-like enzyme
MGFFPEQVQDFYPTPGSVATAMYYTGINPLTLEVVYVPKGREKNMQRALVQYQKRDNYLLVYEALRKAYREDLIGSGKKALIPEKVKSSNRQNSQAKKASSSQSVQTKQSKINQKDKSRGKNGKKINRIH